MTTYQKDKSGKLDYTIDWSDWLNGDIIASSTWTVPSDLTQVSAGIDSPATTTTIWLTGGTLGSFHKVSNKITTNTSPQRIATRSIYLEIVKR